MQPFTLSQAAKESKKSKSTISEAISSGRLSAFKDDNGHYQIDPSELFRVYPPNVRKSVLETATEPKTELAERELLNQKIEFLERQLEREKEFVLSLEKRLDDESAERRKLTALLTHQPQLRIAESKGNKLWKKIFKK